MSRDRIGEVDFSQLVPALETAVTDTYRAMVAGLVAREAEESLVPMARWVPWPLLPKTGFGTF